MEVTGSNGNTGNNENMDFHVVVLMNEDGSEEVFKFPKSPPQVQQPQPQPPIVIEDSSDTESEAEEEMEQEKKEEKKKEDAEEKTEEAEKEKQEEEEEETEKSKEAQEYVESEAEKQQEEEKETKKRRRDFIVNEPTPERASRSNRFLSNNEQIQPAPTMTPAPIPSDLFPPPKLSTVNSESVMQIELTNALATTSSSPVLQPVPTPLSPPTSPLPVLDFTMDIDDFDKKI